jgi:hypothetical protein
MTLDRLVFRHRSHADPHAVDLATGGAIWLSLGSVVTRHTEAGKRRVKSARSISSFDRIGLSKRQSKWEIMAIHK